MATLSDNVAEAAFREPAAPSSKLRWPLFVVCGGLLVLLVVSGVMAARFLDDMRAHELAVTRALAERTQMLSGLSLSIQNYNQAVQQYVAQSNADRVEADRRRIDEIALEIDSVLKHYPRNRDPLEAAMLEAMQELFAQERTLYVTILTPGPEARRREAENQMAARRAPLEKKILDWTDKLHSWNDERLRGADRALQGQFETTMAGLVRALAIGLGSGLLLVAASMFYIARLERQTRARYVALARSQHELQVLSARLVDAQETERRSISRELHDEVGQDLGAMLVTIGRLASEAGNDPQRQAEVDQLKSMAERTFQSVRNMALLLRPSMLDDLGLAAALEWQGREVSRRSQVEVAVEAENIPEEMPDEYKICIYRLVQEALNNAVRHSGAKNARVTVGAHDHSIAVRVADDGRGFEPGRVRGMGILGMEERVKRLGGNFAIASEPAHGATITAELPFPPPAVGGLG
jgi:signal transduction histidine kinase